MANPTGKGGFQERKQDINRNGRKKGADLLLAAINAEMTPENAKTIAKTLMAGAKRGNPKDREHLCAILGIDLKTVTLKGDADQPLRIVVEHVRDTDKTT